MSEFKLAFRMKVSTASAAKSEVIAKVSDVCHAVSMASRTGSDGIVKAIATFRHAHRDPPPKQKKTDDGTESSVKPKLPPPKTTYVFRLDAVVRISDQEKASTHAAIRIVKDRFRFADLFAVHSELVS